MWRRLAQIKKAVKSKKQTKSVVCDIHFSPIFCGQYQSILGRYWRISLLDRKESYSLFIRQHYEDYASNIAYHYGKSHAKINKLKCYLKFLEQCWKEKLLPTFIDFHNAPFYTRYEPVINKCYHQISINEIKSKKKEQWLIDSPID
jgi:hypothetical protein